LYRSAGWWMKLWKPLLFATSLMWSTIMIKTS
jgi:hypothetical protein